MSTRSGTVLSQGVHYYYDISDIPTIESIELSPLSETLGTQFIEHPEAESSFIDELNINTEDVLMDSYNDDFTSAHLIFNNIEGEEDIESIPTLISDVGLRTLPIISDIFISEQNLNSDSTFNLPPIPLEPVVPTKGTVVDSFDFYLHPSLTKRKRKRRKRYYF